MKDYAQIEVESREEKITDIQEKIDQANKLYAEYQEHYKYDENRNPARDAADTMPLLFEVINELQEEVKDVRFMNEWLSENLALSNELLESEGKHE